MKNLTKKIYLLITAIIVAVPLIVIGVLSGNKKPEDGGLAVETPVEELGVTAPEHNYFVNAYGLEDGHVFKSVIWKGLSDILDADGTFVILFGGAWSAETREVAPYINDKAKEYGVSRIYVFDFKLDGGIVDGVNADITSAKHELNYLYKAIFDKLTNYQKVSGNLDTFSALIPAGAVDGKTYVKANGDEVDAEDVSYLAEETLVKIKTPTLLSYNKSSVSGPVLAVLDTEYNDNYEAELDGFFKKTAKLALRGSSTDRVNSASYDYFSGVAEAQEWGTDVHIFEQVTYAHLIDLFESGDHFALLIGGLWSDYVQTVIGQINELGSYYGLKKIYVFDPRLDGYSSQPKSAYIPTGAVTEAGEVVVKSGRYISSVNIAGEFNLAGKLNEKGIAYGKLYVKLLSYLGEFTSLWNDKDFGDDIVTTVKIEGVDYTKIAEATLLVFDKELGVVASYEAEYTAQDEAEGYIEAGLADLLATHNRLYNPDFVPGAPAVVETPSTDETPDVIIVVPIIPNTPITPVAPPEEVDPCAV